MEFFQRKYSLGLIPSQEIHKKGFRVLDSGLGFSSAPDSSSNPSSSHDSAPVLRQLHCDKHKADNPFSLDTLHLHHFSVMSLTSVLLQPGNAGGKSPFSRAGSFLQISQISVKSGRVCSTVGKMCTSKAPN